MKCSGRSDIKSLILAGVEVYLRKDCMEKKEYAPELKDKGI